MLFNIIARNVLFCYTNRMKKSLFAVFLVTGLFIITGIFAYAKTSDETEIFVMRTDKGTSTTVAKKIHNTSTRKIYHFLSEINFSKPENLYEGAYDAVRIIKQAEKRYYREHDAYTANIANLNLTFPNAQKQLFVNNTSRIYLDNGFYYVLTDKLVAVYFAAPSDYRMAYHLDFHFDGTQQCISATVQAKATCEKLGGTNSTVNPRMKNWTVYDLPEDFL